MAAGYVVLCPSLCAGSSAKISPQCSGFQSSATNDPHGPPLAPCNENTRPFRVARSAGMRRMLVHSQPAARLPPGLENVCPPRSTLDASANTLCMKLAERSLFHHTASQQIPSSSFDSGAGACNVQPCSPCGSECRSSARDSPQRPSGLRRSRTSWSSPPPSPSRAPFARRWRWSVNVPLPTQILWLTNLKCTKVHFRRFSRKSTRSQFDSARPTHNLELQSSSSSNRHRILWWWGVALPLSFAALSRFPWRLLIWLRREGA